MNQRGLIAPEAQSTPVTIGGSHRERDVPEDLLREATKRLEIITLLAAILWPVASFLWHLRAEGGLHVTPYQAGDNFAVLGTVTSAALYVYARQTKRDARFILILGLVYMVVTAFELGLISHWFVSPVNPHAPIE